MFSVHPHVYGVILHTTHTDARNVRYALVQGRYSGKWSFPKGHMKENETPYTCALREMEEEVGCVLNIEPTHCVYAGYGQYYVFPCPSAFPLVPNDMGEIIQARWVTYDEMSHLSLNVDVNRYRKGLRASSVTKHNENNRRVRENDTCQNRRNVWKEQHRQLQ